MKTLIAIVTVIAIIVNVPLTNGQARNVPKVTETNAKVQILRGSQKPPFNTIRIEKVQIAKIEIFGTSTTQFNISIRNNSTKPIEKFSLYIVAREKGRTIPLAENEFRFEPIAGLEPQETKTVSVSTNPLGQKKWSALTLDDINKADIAAELIAVTFYREREIKSDTANAKNANWSDDKPIPFPEIKFDIKVPEITPLTKPNFPNINPPRPQQPQTPARPTPPRR